MQKAIDTIFRAYKQAKDSIGKKCYDQLTVAFCDELGDKLLKVIKEVCVPILPETFFKDSMDISIKVVAFEHSVYVLGLTDQTRRLFHIIIEHDENNRYPYWIGDCND